MAAHKMVIRLWLMLTLVWLVAVNTEQVGRKTKFKAAVFEQKLSNAWSARTREDAMVAINNNLRRMDIRARRASEQGVDVMVFAEYGVTGYMGPEWTSRSALYPYSEVIPAVSPENPVCYTCNETAYKQEGQIAIGCMALKYHMYVLGNLIESMPCDKTTDERCPQDGQYLFNTNVVFDRNGCMIARYRKYHRFTDEFFRIDMPHQVEYAYFDTEFGRVSTMICMDAMFVEPGITLIDKYKVDHILFPTAWDNINDYVYLMPIQWQIAFAYRFDVNIIGANVRSYQDYTFGSGIFNGKRVVSYTATYENVPGQLLIGELPSEAPYKSLENRPQLQQHSARRFNTIRNARRGPVVVYGDVYNAVVLRGRYGHVRTCQKSLCCELEYQRNSTRETFILGAFKGVHSMEGAMAYENCVVYKCAGPRLATCEERQIVGETSFQYFHLTGTMSVEYVFPSLLPSELKYENLDWSFDPETRHSPNAITVSSDWPLLGASLVGRDYENDEQI